MSTTSHRIALPAVGDPVDLVCGCTGHVRYGVRGEWPTVGVLVKVPCAAGHPETVAPGVIIHVAPEALRG